MKADFPSSPAVGAIYTANNVIWTWTGKQWTKVYINTGVTKAYVDTSISNLVNGAGPALDTLNELATALNNDATFSTTVTNLIAAKAPIASPIFTGTVTLAADPTLNLQAATKAYVDDLIAAGSQVIISDTAPTSPTTGAVWFNSLNGITSIYYDSTWVDVGGGDSVNSIATGMVMYYCADSAPPGWIECNGAVITTALGASYTALRTLLLGGSSPFGVVGSDPRIPDLRGKFIRSNGSDGEYSSAAFGVTQADAFEAHSHTFSIHWDTLANGSYPESTIDGRVASSSATTAKTGGTETRPVNIALLACIKL